MKYKCCNDKKSLSEISQISDFLKVIGEENRFKIICLLKNNKEVCVCDIYQHLNITQNLTSHHLKVLKDFGLVFSRKDGLKIFYSLNKKDLTKNLKMLNKYVNYEKRNY